MSKRKANRNDLSSETKTSRAELRRNAKRVASIEIIENQEGGVDVDFFDSKVRSTGRLKCFDTIAHLAQQHVYHGVEDLMENNPTLKVKTRYPRQDKLKQDLRSKTDKLEAVRVFLLSVKTVGDEKTPAINILKSINKIIK